MTTQRPRVRSEATPEAYFDLVPKTKLMAVVTETSGEKLAAEIGKIRQPDL